MQETEETMETPQKIQEYISQLLQQRTTKQSFRINLKKDEFRDILTAAYYAEVIARNRQFEANAETERIIDEVSEALTNPTHKTGLILLGTCGNGKSTLVRALQNALIFLKRRNICENGLRVVDAREVADRIKECKECPLLSIEDMGKESAAKLDYGNVVTPVIEVLERRYDEQLFTVISSNLSNEEIRQKYGDRIADRFNEMMNVIIFKNKSFRK